MASVSQLSGGNSAILITLRSGDCAKSISFGLLGVMTTNEPGAATVTVGQYLALRLRELGVRHIFGLPGDFNLALIDEMLRVEGVEWVGTTNELNASYAADGYARLSRGPAALVTTYGVGELSAINGVAGSYAENVPVVHIVGMPSTVAQDSRQLLHHSLADGDFDHFLRAAAEVTAATVVVREEGASSTIDRALLTAITQSRPIYIGVPRDVSDAPVSARPLERPLRSARSDPHQLATFRQQLERTIASHADVRMLIGPLVHRRALESTVRSIAASSDVFVATQSASKAILDESHPGNLGVYGGEHTAHERTRTMIEGAQPLILAGVLMTDFLTGFFTHQFNYATAICLDLDSARIGDEIFYDVHLHDSLCVLNEVVAVRGERPIPETHPEGLEHISRGDVVEAEARPADLLTHAVLWPKIQRWLRPGTTLFAEAGTSFYGAVTLTLPDDCELFGQPVWSSIGFTLPAMLGAMIARPERTAVLIIGDGSAQLTIQELATILHRGLAPTIVLLDNAGYTVERLIRSPDAVYQDVVPWNWVALAIAFGVQPERALTVATPAELDDALRLADGTSATFIHVTLPRDDSPELLTRIAHGVR